MTGVHIKCLAAFLASGRKVKEANALGGLILLGIGRKTASAIFERAVGQKMLRPFKSEVRSLTATAGTMPFLCQARW